MANKKLLVSSRVFNAIQSFDIKDLSECLLDEIRPILPCLVRISLVQPSDMFKDCADARIKLLTVLSNIEHVNAIVALLTIDFYTLEGDIKKELKLRQKSGVYSSEGFLVPPVQSGLSLEFERGDSARRLRLVLSEIFRISSQVRDQQSVKIVPSELFDHIIYIEEVCDAICIAIAELPSVLNVVEVADTLLHVNHGPEIISRVVANSPDTFQDVCYSLIAGGERHEDENVGGKVRMQTILMLCHMNPSFALSARAKCVELCRMPALTILLSLEFSKFTDREDEDDDLVSFISGLLLGSDQQVRNWFSLYVRSSQKRKIESHTILQQCRDDIQGRLRAIIQSAKDQKLPDPYVVKASSLLRLYCALRGIAGLKFQDEEVTLLVQLLTCHPPATIAGVRFVSLGLCMIIAFPALISHHDHEKCCIQWVQWLVKEEAYFESACNSAASFGEMLLLIAIHFHSNQLSAIWELVCTTLGMKVPNRTNNLTRVKQIFVQEIFTEQVVASHAVKVPVTINLNANIPGFLPVHCIHQLLKSRVFSKHRVPIKDWIYRQICSCAAPIHSVLPSLIEVFVNSILIQSPKASHDHTNTPITEDEILSVFQNSISSNSDSPSLTSQLLLLYYLLLYEDTRLANMSQIVSSNRDVKVYSTDFMSQIPIKFLLRQAQQEQQNYTGLFSPLLKLLATHYPHLSLVDDWLKDEVSNEKTGTNFFQLSEAQLSTPLTDDFITQAFSHIGSHPLQTRTMLQRLRSVKSTELWTHSGVFIKHLKLMLDHKIPRFIQELYKEVWLSLNEVLPEKLWVMTVEALVPKDVIEDKTVVNWDTMMIDPFIVLRCDKKVFRCAPALDIVLKVLEATLAASRNYMLKYMQENPVTDKSGQLGNDTERDELRSALISLQESSCLQILLEACLKREDDTDEPWFELALREIRCIICTFVHHMFIADPSLAKIIHFQGYPRELLPVTIPGIPSLHISLDFIPELLSQPDLEKQIFAIDLVSHLALKYTVPRSFNMCRLCVNTLSTLLGTLPSMSRIELFDAVMPSLVRISQAFPVLVEDITTVLMQLGQICTAQDALVVSMPSNPEFDNELNLNRKLCEKVETTLDQIFKTALLPVAQY